MRKLVTALVLVPLGIVIVMFAVANREIHHDLVRSHSIREIRRWR